MTVRIEVRYTAQRSSTHCLRRLTQPASLGNPLLEASAEGLPAVVGTLRGATGAPVLAPPTTAGNHPAIPSQGSRPFHGEQAVQRSPVDQPAPPPRDASARAVYSTGFTRYAAVRSSFLRICHR